MLVIIFKYTEKCRVCQISTTKNKNKKALFPICYAVFAYYTSK